MRDGAAWGHDAASADATGVGPLWCAGERTSRIEVGGALDAVSTLPEWWTWDPAYPYLAMYFPVYDGATRADLALAFEPTPRAPLAWDYHLVLTDPLLDVGHGTLSFDTSGTLIHHEVTLPAVLPGGESWPIELWFGTPTDEGGSGRDGMVGMGEANGFTYLSVDGEARALGAPCKHEGGATPSRVAPSCPAEATRRIGLRANLGWASELAREPWDPLHPLTQAALRAQVFAYDEAGAAAAIELFFRKLADGSWEYRALLAGDPTGHELGSGALGFAPDGTLAVHRVFTPLRLPRLDGSAGPAIELDFGLSTNAGGNGVDGLTSFAQETWVLGGTRDGHAGRLAACPAPSTESSLDAPPPFFDPSAVPAPVAPSPAGRMTTVLRLSACLDPSTPVAERQFDLDHPFETSAISLGAEMFDAELTPRHVDMHLRNEGDGLWTGHLVMQVQGHPRQIGAASWWLDQSGELQHDEWSFDLRFPLSSGREGPRVDVEIGDSDYTQFVAWCPGDPHAAIWADGSAATSP